MNERCDEERNDRYGALYRGRRPFAVANMEGSGDYPSVRGSVWFYATPLGILITAELCGLPRQKEGRRIPAVYGFCWENETELCRNGVSSCMKLPMVYEKDGCGACSYLTQKLNGGDLAARTIVLRERHPASPCTAVAYGVVRRCEERERTR